LSLTCRVAVRAPAPLGENATLIVQVVPTASVGPQVLLVIVNWRGFAPPSAMRVIVSGAVPVLDKVNANGALVVPLGTLPKLLEAGVRVATAWPPVPVRVTLAGLATSDVAMATVPVSTPVVVGANRTVIVQLLPAARETPFLGQVSDSEKGPVTVMGLAGNVRGVVPTFTSVTFWPALVVPTSWLPNNKVLVLRLTWLTTWVTAAEELARKLALPP